MFDWRWLAGAVGIVLLLAFVWYSGYTNADKKWTYKYQQREIEISQTLAKEQERQWQANQRAKQLEAERIAKLRQRELELEAQIEELNNEAANDPDANTTSITIGGVRRLNTIR